MRKARVNAVLLVGASFNALCAAANAQTSGPEQQKVQNSQEWNVGEIVVTAQKREQSLNDVPMSVTALTGQGLIERGVTSTADLVKVVPGLTFTQASNFVPIYTLRGVGLYDAGIGSSPAVSVYVDQVPRTFPAMTTGVALDLERVEVLKGPQGILFGQNSTGGAINYVAAKPTSSFQAGGTLSVDHFGQADLTGYVSGPLSDTLGARVAVRTVQGGAWQYSASRPKDKLGNSNLFVGRILLDWKPTDQLSFLLNINGNKDRSDVQAPQVTDLCIACNPTSPLTPIIEAQPITPKRPRAAEWTADWPMKVDNSFWQVALTTNYELNDSLTLTSITSYQDQKIEAFHDNDGTALQIFDNRLFGGVKAFNQELRLAGATERVNWLLGASYEHNKVDDNYTYNVRDYSNNVIFPDIPASVQSSSSLKTKTNTYAAFAHGEFSLTDQLRVSGGLRYTKSELSAVNCAYDSGASLGLVFVRLQEIYQSLGIKTTPVMPIGVAECYALDADYNPGPLSQKLNEDNLSFRADVDYTTAGGALLYANISRGYKSGVITNVSAATTVQYFPAVQERVYAYEAGFKAPLLDRKVQLNAAAFYYDYSNKQVRGRIIDPIWGPVERIVNVPKSRIWGIEGELTAKPIEGLTLRASATYLDSKVTDEFQNFNAAGTPGDFRGSPLPFTPKFQAAADIEYRWPLGDTLEAFAGTGLTHHSSDQSTFTINGTKPARYLLPSYTLLDLRAGVGSQDGGWQFSVWGRNVTNEYYVTTVFETTESFFRYTGRPATFGATLTLKTR